MTATVAAGVGRRVLITGASGFLGLPLTEALLAAGHQVTALCRDHAPLARLAQPSLRLVHCELAEMTTAARFTELVAGAEVVFHLAAQRNQPGASPERMALVNVDATVALATAARAAGVARFVHLSSALAYTGGVAPRDETASVDPDLATSLYAATRARAVLALRALRADGLDVVILAPTIVYGPDHLGHRNRVTDFMRRAARSRLMVWPGDGRARRDLVHRDDVVCASVLAGFSPGLGGRELLLGSEAVSARELVALVARLTGRPPPVAVGVPLSVVRPVARGLDFFRRHDDRCGFASAVDGFAGEWLYRSHRSWHHLGFVPRSLVAGVEETLAWLNSSAQKGLRIGDP